METIKEATGAAIRPFDLSYETILYASDFGAAPKKSAVENTQAINKAILAASKQGGATVVIAKGEYRTYTIELKSHVHLHFEEGAVIRAARTDIKHSYVNQDGEGGRKSIVLQVCRIMVTAILQTVCFMVQICVIS